MEADETATLAGLRQLRRKLFEPTVSAYRGGVLKRMGDGWLVEFANMRLLPALMPLFIRIWKVVHAFT